MMHTRDLSRHPLTHTELPSIYLVPAAWRARRVAVAVALTSLAGIALLVLAPWPQNVPGQGRVVAYAPLDRQQTSEAPVKGRVVRWWVQEGSTVKAGEPLLEISDNDPLYIERLEAQKTALVAQLATYERQQEALSQNTEAAERARDHKAQAARSKIRAAERKLNQTRQKLQASQAKLEQALLNLARQQALFDEGLTSKLKLEQSQLKETTARTERAAAQQAVEAQREMLMVERARFDLDVAEADGKVEKARADLSKAEAQMAAGQAKMVEIDSKIARQSTQRVTAPRDGTILKLVAAQGGEQVKPGDALLVLVPEEKERAVELWVDGNDAALLSPGRQVRLQFEGWPAIQFTGWPSIATGTFGGEVAFIDATDDGKGNFRILVRPLEGDEPWPEAHHLRQGVRANGWIMLEQVRLGYEVWRQLNGFPAAVDPPGAEDMKKAGGGKKKK